MTEMFVDFRDIAISHPSICIPRVFSNISKDRISHVFHELYLGKIARIDLKERKNEKGETYNRVFIHFEEWFFNTEAESVRRKLLAGKEIKIVYDNPWFWKASANSWTDTNTVKKPARNPKIFIEFDDETRNMVADEFGRDLSLRPDRCPDTRPDTRIQDTRIPDPL